MSQDSGSARDTLAPLAPVRGEGLGVRGLLHVIEKASPSSKTHSSQE
jgi:hypothetical protein